MPGQRSPSSKSSKKKHKPKNRKIHKEHPEFELTYDMMLGIRTTTSQVESKPFRPLTTEDFDHCVKLEFPGGGSNVTPAHEMRNFKFKDYCPEVFRHIRRRFGLNPIDYLLCVCGNFEYLEFISNSKSGEFFFYTHDRKFMIKTISQEEEVFLKEILPHYYKHCMKHPNTLLTRFYGMHRVKPHKKREVHFLIMGSVFCTLKFINITFDLKGSRQGRSASEKDKKRANCVWKDNDFMDMGVKLQIGSKNAERLNAQLSEDAEFLRKLDIMDYSLLLGVHYKNQGDVFCTPDQVDPNAPVPNRTSMSVSQTPRSNAPTALAPVEEETQQADEKTEQKQSLPAASEIIESTANDEDEKKNLANVTIDQADIMINVTSPSGYKSGEESGNEESDDFLNPGLPSRVQSTPQTTADDTRIVTASEREARRKSSKLGMLRSATMSNFGRNANQSLLSPEPVVDLKRQSLYGLPKRWNKLSRPSDIKSFKVFPPVPHLDQLDAEIRDKKTGEIPAPDPTLFDSKENSTRSNALSPPNTPHSRVGSSDSLRPLPMERTVSGSFTLPDGGVLGMTEDGQPTNEIYYMGIIDILTIYNTRKKLENLIKSVQYDPRDISAVDPTSYAIRFKRFLADAIK